MPSWPAPSPPSNATTPAAASRMTVIHCDQKNWSGLPPGYLTYDLHHCAHARNVSICTLILLYRCRGLGVALLCAISADITTLGWTHLRGTALSGRASRLYARVGVCFGTNEYNLSGKALRQLAGPPPWRAQSPKRNPPRPTIPGMNYQP